MARRGVLGGFQFVLDCGKMLLLLYLRVQVRALKGGTYEGRSAHLRSSHVNREDRTSSCIRQAFPDYSSRVLMCLFGFWGP